MDENTIKKLIKETLKEELKSDLFTARKLTDTPTDALQVVNRKYITRNGTTSNRPTSSILGEFYFDTTITRPIWWNGTAWIRADGTVV